MSARKFIVLGLVLGVLGVAGIRSLADWLSDTGAVALAGRIRGEYLPGPALSVILVLLVLAPTQSWTRAQGRQRSAWPFD